MQKKNLNYKRIKKKEKFKMIKYEKVWKGVIWKKVKWTNMSKNKSNMLKMLTIQKNIK